MLSICIAPIGWFTLHLHFAPEFWCTVSHIKPLTLSDKPHPFTTKPHPILKSRQKKILKQMSCKTCLPVF